MKKIVAAIFVTATAAYAEVPACSPTKVEGEIRDLIETVMNLRARQDEAFADYYDDDEYSFPGESWVFKGRERVAERGRAIKASRASGLTWKMDVRDLRVKADCEMAWVTGLVHAARLNDEQKTTHRAEWRLTAVLERRPGGWRIVHQHSSVPVADPRQWWKPVISPN